MYTGKGTKSEFGNPGEVGYYKATTNPMYLEMPLQFVGKLPLTKGMRVIVGAGGYGALGILGKNKTEAKILTGTVYSNRKINFDDNSVNQVGYPNIKRFDYGLNGLAGLEFTRFTLSANYGHGLAKIVPGTSDNTNDRGKHRVISFTFGLIL